MAPPGRQSAADGLESRLSPLEGIAGIAAAGASCARLAGDLEQ